MVAITDKLQLKKIVVLSKLTAIGLNTIKNINKVLNGNLRTVKTVYNTLIKGKNISLEREIKSLISLKQFNSTNYMCSKCETRHYLGSKVYYNHISKSKSNFNYLEQQKLYLSSCMDTIKEIHYDNNKNCKAFQDLVDYTTSTLEKYQNTALNTDLRDYINTKYKTDIKETWNNKLRKENIRIQKNIRLLKEILDHVEYFNFLHNDITRVQKLRMIKATDFNGFIYDYSNDLFNLINSDKDIKEIIGDLDIRNNKINNKLLHKKIINHLREFKEMLYQLNYGISYYNKTDKSNNNYMVGVLPFNDSGRFTLDNKIMDDLNINLFYCYDDSKANKNFSFWYKYMIRNDNITIINHGINEARKLRKLPSHYISYTYKIDAKAHKNIQSLKLKAYTHMNTHKNTEQGRMIDIEFSFDYTNFYTKINKYNRYLRSINLNEQRKYYEVFLPAWNNPKFLNSTFGHLINPSKSFTLNKEGEIRVSKLIKMGNIRREKRSQYTMNVNIAHVLYYMSAKYNLQKECNYKSTENTKLFLSNMILEANSHPLLNKHLHMYYIDKITVINKKVIFLQYKMDYLRNKVNKLKAKYNRINNKRTKIAKQLKSKFTTIESRIEKLHDLINPLIDNKMIIGKFFTDLFVKHEISDISGYIYKLLTNEIKLFYEKTLVRYVNSQRTQKELIQYGLKNIDEIVLMELVNENKDLDTNNDLFDKWINYQGQIKQIKSISKETHIDVVSMLKLINKILYCFNDKKFVNELFDSIYHIVEPFTHLETTLFNTL